MKGELKSNVAFSFSGGVSLKSCVERLKNLTAKEFNVETATLNIEKMLQTLLENKRFFDIAVIYIFLKNGNEYGDKFSEIFNCFNLLLQGRINELFINSITYKSAELDEMFADIFSENHGLFMELISLVFEKYDLFNAKLSENIYKKFISIADEDVSLFIERVNIKFLAFYLSILPTLPFVSKEHIAKWTDIILFNDNSRKSALKIIEAMRLRPSLEILLIFILSSREEERLMAMNILSDCIDSGRVDMGLFSEKIACFAEKALTSTFYYFHAIPRSHKELLASFLIAAGSYSLKSRLVSLLHEKNPNNDHKITETKLVFIPVIQQFMNKFKEIAKELRLVLKDENVEIEVKEAVRKRVVTSRI